MAQDFVGSNNLNWFVPQGQFGTRLQGGKDSASPRYIHTYLQPYISKLVPSEDFDILKYKDDDGLPVEPEWYAPILPMLLVNGSRGIGTGYSTFIPSFNPADLKQALLNLLDSKPSEPLVPYVKGFKGTVEKDGQNYVAKGVFKVNKDVLTITELPPGTWTSDFRETLEKMLLANTIKDFTDMSTDSDILITIKLNSAGTEGFKPFEKLLVEKIKLTNMHAFNSRNIIHKYETPEEILLEYFQTRLELYETRRQHLLKTLKNKLPYHTNIVRFIKQQLENPPLPDLRRRTSEECDDLLSKEKFTKINDEFDYLLDLPIKSLTLKSIQKHQKDLEDLQKDILLIESTNAIALWKKELMKI